MKSGDSTETNPITASLKGPVGANRMHTRILSAAVAVAAVLLTGSRVAFGFVEPEVPPGAEPICSGIPTVSEWGLLITALAVLAAGTIVLRRRMLTSG